MGPLLPGPFVDLLVLYHPDRARTWATWGKMNENVLGRTSFSECICLSPAMNATGGSNPSRVEITALHPFRGSGVYTERIFCVRASRMPRIQ